MNIRNLICCLILLGNSSLHNSTKAEGISELSALKGCWSVMAEEDNTIGEIFRQEGLISVNHDTNVPSLTINRYFEVTEATGLYSGIGPIRKSSQVLRHDKRSNLMFTTDTSANSSVPTVGKAGLSADGKSLFRTFIFYHPRRKMTLFGEDYLRMVSATEVVNETRIKDVFGDYRETYKARWIRTGNSPDTCLP